MSTVDIDPIEKLFADYGLELLTLNDQHIGKVNAETDKEDINLVEIYAKKARTTLKAELLAKMPKKMTIADSPSEEAYINGYSEAITEITKLVEEL